MKKLIFVVLMSLTLGACAAPNGGDQGNSSFDISSLNGKYYHYLYEDDKQVRIPEKEFPYTYTIPEYLNPGSYYDFSWLTIRDSKLYRQHADSRRKESQIIYSLKEEEVPIRMIDNRYFSSMGEIVFGGDLLYVDGGGLCATREYAEKNGYKIFSLESQEKSWVIDSAQPKLSDHCSQYIELSLRKTKQ